MWRNDGNGALAQLGERLHGMQEVSGSIPLGSTILHHAYPEIARTAKAAAARTGAGIPARGVKVADVAIVSGPADTGRLVEPSGIEPLTSCMPCRRSPS